MFNKKFISFFIILLILIVSIGVVSANENITNISNSKSTTSLITEKTFEDIQIAIDESSENETIELEGIYTSQGKEIKINKSITIQSTGGATLDGNYKSNIFNITKGNVCLKNMNFINSNSTTSSAIYNLGNLTIINSNFKNNVHNIPKIYVYEDYENEINKSSGAIYSKNTLNILNSTFTNNYATIIMYSEELQENYTLKWGGAIYSSREISIKKSKFKDNITFKIDFWDIINQGYMIKLESANAIITDSEFSKSRNLIESDSNITLNRCNFKDNSANLIKNYPYDEKSVIKLIIKNCSFINNSKEYPDYSVGDNNIISANSVHIFNSKFINDTSIDAINLIINNSFFTNFTDLIILTVNATVNNTIFVNNTEKIIEGHEIELINSKLINNTIKTDLICGAIHIYKGLIVNSTFTNNINHYAGAILHELTPGGSEWSDDGTYETIKDDEAQELKIINSTFIGNKEAAIVTVNCTIDCEYVGSNIALDNSLKPFDLFTIDVKKFSTIYASGQTMPIKILFGKDKKPAQDSVYIIVKKGKKIYDENYCNSNSKGIINYKASNLPVGTYKITIYGTMIKSTTTITVSQAKTIINAPKVTSKYKKTKYFKVAIKHKTTKKPVKKTYVKIKIDKKTYKIKTNTKGIVKVNTKKLKIGKHKVIITSGNSNYKMSGKSTITIKR